MTHRLRHTLSTAVAAAAVALAPLGVPSAAAAQPIDEVETGWVEHRRVTLYVDIPDGPGDGPTAERPDATVYLIAPLDADNPQAPGAIVPFPDGRTMIVPVHDTVLDRVRPTPVDCFGVLVLPGPRATARTVLTRPDPNGGDDLAYAVRVGPLKVTLNGETSILLAEKLGLVRLDRSWPGYGGRCWTSKPTGWPVLLS